MTISVVVPAYNAARTLTETVASIVAQTLTSIEILLVNDGSTDATGALADTIAQGDPRIRVLHQANGGVAAARNTGLHAARGARVAFIDADDLWHPCHLELLDRHARATGAALVFARCRRIDDQGRIINSSSSADVDGHALARMLFSNLVGNGSGLLVDRAMAMGIGGYDVRLARQGAQGTEDYLFQLRCAARGPVASVPAWTVGYRFSPPQMSTDEERMSQSMQLAVRTFLADHAQDRAFRTIGRWQVAGALWSLGWYRRSRREPFGAAVAIAKAIWLDPEACAAKVTRLLGRGRPHRDPAVPHHFATTDHRQFVAPREPDRADWLARLTYRRWRWVGQLDDAGRSLASSLSSPCGEVTRPEHARGMARRVPAGDRPVPVRPLDPQRRFGRQSGRQSGQGDA